MANHKSALKRHRQSLRRRARNVSVKSRVRTEVKKVRVALGSNDPAAVAAALASAVPALDKAASKGVLHKRTASRKISRLMKAAHKATAGK
ncbi:MAG TPA: 30S ribosomal protein S20 [Thermodesulfobacteriota bacterium]